MSPQCLAHRNSDLAVEIVIEGLKHQPPERHHSEDSEESNGRCRSPTTGSQPSAKRQKATRTAADGTPLHSFRTLLADLATVTPNVCRTKGETETRQTEFELDTQLNAEQARALELLKGIRI